MRVCAQSFLSVLSVLSRGSVSDKITWMFNLYDVERRGKIGRASMRAIFAAVDQMLGVANSSSSSAEPVAARADRVFRDMDANADGLVSFDEFVAWCHRVSECVSPSFTQH